MVTAETFFADLNTPFELPFDYVGGGNSRAFVYLPENLPEEERLRSAIILGHIGAPDRNRVGGMGGGDGDTVTNKAAILSKPTVKGADIDYLFLQAARSKTGIWTLGKTAACGNILATTGGLAVDHGFVKATGELTRVRVHQVNKGTLSNLHIQTDVDGKAVWHGDATFEGVEGTGAPVVIEFGAAKPEAAKKGDRLLPTGKQMDIIDDVPVTVVNYGQLVVVARADSFNLTGYETPEELKANTALWQRIDSIRVKGGVLAGMEEADAKKSDGIKVALLAKPREGGVVSTRCYLNPNGDVHGLLGIFAAVSIGAACYMPDSPVHDLASLPGVGGEKLLSFETPGAKRDIHFNIEGTAENPVFNGGKYQSIAWRHLKPPSVALIDRRRVAEVYRQLGLGTN